MSNFRTILIMGKSVVIQDSDYQPINRRFFDKIIAAKPTTTLAVLLVEYGKITEKWFQPDPAGATDDDMEVQS